MVHGELCAEHTLFGPDGEPVIIDVEGLMYTDVEVEHCWMRMRFGPHYEALRDPDLDPRRVRYYQYVMHLDLVGGPLRIAEGDFPNREWMLDVADFHLQKALAYEHEPTAGPQPIAASHRRGGKQRAGGRAHPGGDDVLGRGEV